MGSLSPTPDRIQRIAEFRSALAAFLERSGAGARRHGLTPQRYLLLLMIKGAPDGNERVTMGELAARLRISANTASELVSRAARAGLVVRERSAADLRVVELRLTDEGERRLAQAVAATDADRRLLSQAFQRLAETFEQATHRAGPGPR